MSDDNPRDECEHGRLRRKCEQCSDAEEITRLTAERDEARAEIERLKAWQTEHRVEYAERVKETVQATRDMGRAQAERDALRARLDATAAVVEALPRCGIGRTTACLQGEACDAIATRWAIRGTGVEYRCDAHGHEHQRFWGLTYATALRALSALQGEQDSGGVGSIPADADGTGKPTPAGGSTDSESKEGGDADVGSGPVAAPERNVAGAADRTSAEAPQFDPKAAGVRAVVHGADFNTREAWPRTQREPWGPVPGAPTRPDPLTIAEVRFEIAAAIAAERERVAEACERLGNMGLPYGDEALAALGRALRSLDPAGGKGE